MRIPVVVVAAALVLAGCASGSAQSAANGTPAPSVPSVSIVDPDAAFYIETLQDWKDYGDAIVTVHVTAQRVDPDTSSDPDVNAGLIDRRADFQVTHTFWVRDEAHRPPTTFTASVWGWWDKVGRPRVPIASKGDPRYVPGHDYLVALDRFSDGWATATGLPFDDGTVGTGEWLGRAEQDEPGATELIGHDEAGVQRLLDSVQRRR